MQYKENGSNIFLTPQDVLRKELLSVLALWN